MLENDLALTVSLDGKWTFQLAGQEPIQIQVPSSWEAQVVDRITDGPAYYRRQFETNQVTACVILHCDAISLAAKIWLNGHLVGEHTGMWSSFQLEITGYVRVGINELVIEVWKPGQRYPLRESLAGFLPDVANTFGGIWQPIKLCLFENFIFNELRIVAKEEGQLAISGSIIGSGADHVNIKVQDDNGVTLVAQALSVDQGTFSLDAVFSNISLWRAESPVCYTLVCTVWHVGNIVACAKRRFGFRSVTTQADCVMIGNHPQHIRGVLSWGWDAQQHCPTPTTLQVRADFAKARAMGFNLFKLCLFVPDETLFDIADEIGMLLWLELPLWQPTMTPALRELVLREYEAILRRVHHHPSIVMLSLGCELDQQADVGLLDALSVIVKLWMPNVLRCDNSGSGEAYGGVTGIRSEYRDFYDYHFYCEPHYFQLLIDHFERAYQPRKPWIFGEFCDADTLRDFNLLQPLPWWLTGPLTFQRDELTGLYEHRQRLEAAGITDGGAALTAIARMQAFAVRKFVLERVRLNFAGGGYVVTGWVDTPIATSGMLDDFGEFKFDPAAWRTINAECVLVLDRGRSRVWAQGGDRPRYRDPYVFWSDELCDLQVVIANGGSSIQDWTLRYSLSSDAVATCVEAQTVELNSYFIFYLPTLVFNTDENLKVELSVNNQCLCESSWPLISIPATQRDCAPQNVSRTLDLAALSADLMRSVVDGESYVIWLRTESEFTQAKPFWRESIHVFDTHPFWETIRHEDHADMRFFSVATDFAVDTASLTGFLRKHCLCEFNLLEINPVWRRFDARAMTWLEYVVEVRYGRGRLLISTLRFAGGLGQQPNTLTDNPMGCRLLNRLFELTHPA